MRRQAIFFLVLAVLLGGLAAILALQVLRSSDDAPSTVREMATEEVVVAARDIEFGALLETEDVRTAEWPADALPEGYSGSPSDVVGRGALLPIRANEPILSSKLALPEAGAGLSINIPEGQRAITIRVDDVVGVGGFVRPGHRVDVFVTADEQAGVSEAQTRLLLQNVPVAATGVTIEPNPQGEPESVPHATLHLSPEQVERLIMAAENATFQLALRNPLDADSVETPGVRFSRLIAGAPAPRAPVASSSPGPQRPAQRTLEVYRGNQRSTSTVDTSVVGGGGGGGGGGR